MSTLKTNAVQIGQSATASENFTLTTGVDGTITLARGNVGATTDDVLTVAATGDISFPGDSSLLGKVFVSAEQTITAAGALTIPHGLVTSPSLIQCRLICKTAEQGYSIGDEVIIAAGFNSTAAADSYGIAVVPDATNLNIRYGSNATVFIITNKTTGGGVPITIANWKLIVRAWK